MKETILAAKFYAKSIARAYTRSQKPAASGTGDSRRYKGKKMKRILLIFPLIFLLNFPGYSNAEKIFKGLKDDEITTAANVTAVYKGPSFPDDKFKKLNLPKRFWGAYYRLIYSFGEIYEVVTVELIGLYEESEPEIISSYILPLNENPDYSFKGKVGFNGWIDHRTFKIGTSLIKKVKIHSQGKYSFIYD